MQTFDAAYLKKMGFAFATAAEAELFSALVSAEYAARLEAERGYLIEDDCFDDFDEDFSTESSREDSPEYRMMVNRCKLGLLRELRAYRTEIAGLLAVPEPVLMTTALEELDLSVRSFNCLKRAGIHTVGAIIDHGDLTNIHNFGRKCVTEIMDMLCEMGIL